MITEIEIEGFKSLEKVQLKLGGLNLFIGANASGKSNFFDALRILQGIGYGFTIDEILNGKPKSATSEIWEPIRGGDTQVQFRRRGRPEVRQKPIYFSIADKSQKEPHILYAIGFHPQPSFVHSEVFRIGSPQVLADLHWQGAAIPAGADFPSTSVAHVGDSTTIQRFGLKTRETSLHSLLNDPSLGLGQREQVKGLVRTISNVQRIEPSITLLREYSQPRKTLRMGERGENFAALVKTILSERVSKDAYLSWLRQLTPIELDDVVILEGALGEPLFALKEGSNVAPAPILSDGTLRFAAITAAFFQPDMPDIITLEEIENGIHPSRLRLLMELLKSQSGGSGPQVFATTHSPVVLAWLDEKDYETTFLCKRDEETGASIIKPLSEIPHLIDLVRKQPIGELFTEGWLEGAF